MSVFDTVDFDDHEHVSFFSDRDTGLRAIIAIHSSGAFGGAGGGCRMWPYASEGDAIRDALRLSRAMSYKLALAGVPSGGAKAVVIGDPSTGKTEALLRALGRAVHRLGGRFIMGEDVGTTSQDMQVVHEETPFVMAGRNGTAERTGTAIYTAMGVFIGLEVAVQHKLEGRDLHGVRVAVQGVGHVGEALAKRLIEAGAEVTITDVNPSALDRVQRATGARAVEPEAIYDVEADVFAPCALGAVLNDETIPRLRCSIVAGSANNQLDRDEHADVLAARGILYAPDFVLNAGGVIGARESLGTEPTSHAATPAVALDKLAPIRDTLEKVLDLAERNGVTPHAAAVALAKEALRGQRL